MRFARGLPSVLLFLSAFLGAQKDFSFDVVLKNWVPQVTPTIATDAGGGISQVHQAALWRRDAYPFFLADMVALEGTWNLDKWSWGVGYEFGADWYAVDAAQSTNGAVTSPVSFRAQAFQHWAYAKGVWHLKHRHGDGIFFGLKAGPLMRNFGVVAGDGTQLIVTSNQLKAFAAIPIQAPTFGLQASAMVGFRFHLLPATFKGWKPGFRIWAEYQFGTDSPLYGFGFGSRAGKVGDSAGNPALRFDATGLTVGVAAFVSVPLGSWRDGSPSE